MRAGLSARATTPKGAARSVLRPAAVAAGGVLPRGEAAPTCTARVPCVRSPARSSPPAPRFAARVAGLAPRGRAGLPLARLACSCRACGRVAAGLSCGRRSPTGPSWIGRLGSASRDHLTVVCWACPPGSTRRRPWPAPSTRRASCPVWVLRGSRRRHRAPSAWRPAAGAADAADAPAGLRGRGQDLLDRGRDGGRRRARDDREGVVLAWPARARPMTVPFDEVDVAARVHRAPSRARPRCGRAHRSPRPGRSPPGGCRPCR